MPLPGFGQDRWGISYWGGVAPVPQDDINGSFEVPGHGAGQARRWTWRPHTAIEVARIGSGSVDVFESGWLLDTNEPDGPAFPGGEDGFESGWNVSLIDETLSGYETADLGPGGEDPFDSHMDDESGDVYVAVVFDPLAQPEEPFDPWMSPREDDVVWVEAVLFNENFSDWPPTEHVTQESFEEAADPTTWPDAGGDPESAHWPDWPGFLM